MIIFFRTGDNFLTLLNLGDSIGVMLLARAKIKLFHSVGYLSTLKHQLFILTQISQLNDDDNENDYKDEKSYSPNSPISLSGNESEGFK